LPEANEFAILASCVPAFGFIFYGETRHKRIPPQSGLARKYGFVFGKIYNIVFSCKVFETL